MQENKKDSPWLEGKTLRLKLSKEEMNIRIIECLREDARFFDTFGVIPRPRLSQYGNIVKMDLEEYLLYQLLPYSQRVKIEKVDWSYPHTDDLVDSYFNYKGVNADHWNLHFSERARKTANLMLADIKIQDEKKMLYREVLTYMIQSEACSEEYNQLGSTVEDGYTISNLLKKNPEFFWEAFSYAEQEVKKLSEIHKKYMDEIIQGPFKDLTVRLRYSEAVLENPLTHEVFKHGYALRGEEAYLFLVALNRKDKELIDKDFPESKTVNFRLLYKDYDYGEWYIDLGSWKCNNATTITEVLKDRPNLMGKWSEFFNENKKNVQAFNVEEDQYLKDHPQIETVNQYKCQMRLYHSKTSEKFGKSYISIKKPEDYDFPEMGGRIIEAIKRKTKSEMDFFGLTPFYTKEELKTLKNLNDFTITLIAADTQFKWSGRAGMALLHDIIAKDRAEYKNIIEKGVQKIHENSKMTFNIEFQQFKRENIEVFIGRLDTGNEKSLVDTMRYLGGDIMPEENENLRQLAEVEKLEYKYCDYENLVYPSQEEPGRLDPRGNVLAYYKKVAELNGKKNDLPFIVKAMVDDGWRKEKIFHVLNDGVFQDVRKEINRVLSKDKKRGL